MQVISTALFVQPGQPLDHFTGANEFVFDQSGKPWHIRSAVSDGLLITPHDGMMTNVSGILPQDEGYVHYLKHTIADAASHIEAHDLRIDAMNVDPAILAVLTNVKFDFVSELASTTHPENEQTIEFVSHGVVWGPVNLDFRTVKTEWPFGGKIPVQDTTFEPRGSGCIFKHDVYSVWVEKREVVLFAMSVERHGFHEAAKLLLARGIRLTSADEVDEMLVTG